MEKEYKMTITDFVKTNTQIISMLAMQFKIFDIGRDGTPCVFDSTKDAFSTFVYYCDYEIDHWFYYSDGKEKAYWIFIDGGED